MYCIFRFSLNPFLSKTETWGGGWGRGREWVAIERIRSNIVAPVRWKKDSLIQKLPRGKIVLCVVGVANYGQLRRD